MARELSPEARERLSKLATERHANGGFGDPSENGKKGGRPAQKATKRKERITKRVAEAAAEEKNAQQIIQVFKDAIHESQPMHVRLKGAETWARIAQENSKFELQEEVQGEAAKSREELIAIMKGKLSGGPVANILVKQLEAENIPDAEVVEESVNGD